MTVHRQPALQTLRLRDVRYFAVSRFFGLTARSLLLAAIAWHLFDLTGSYFYLGLLGLVQFLPVIPVSLLGGAIADTRDRRSLVLVARAGALLCAAALGLGTGLLAHELWLILGVAFALAVAGGFESPAGAALLPALVSREVFRSAVVVSSTARNLGVVTGPVLSGFAIDAAGLGAAYALSAALFALSLGALSRVRPARVQAGRAPVSLASIWEGIAFVWRRPVILGSMSLDMLAVIFASVTALLPVYAKEILQVGPRGYGLLGTSISIGTLLMTLILLFRPAIVRPGRALLVCVFFFGLATILFGLSRSFPLSLGALVLAGMADEVSMVARVTILQLSTPDALRGRVNAVNMVFVGASNELGAAESGFLAALTSPTFSVVAGGFACLGALGIVTARVPALRRHRVD
jgi:MFS family permease